MLTSWRGFLHCDTTHDIQKRTKFCAAPRDMRRGIGIGRVGLLFGLLLLPAYVCAVCSQTPTTYNFSLIFSTGVAQASELLLTRNAIALALTTVSSILGNDSIALLPVIDDGCAASTSPNLSAAAALAARGSSVMSFGGSCPSASQALINASTPAQAPFLPLSANTAYQTSSSLFPYALDLDEYPPGMLPLVGQAIASVFHYFDWTKVGIFSADDVNSIRLRTSLFKYISSPTSANTNATVAAQYTKIHINTGTERYATIVGPLAGEWPDNNPPPLPMYVVPPHTQLPSNERDPTLSSLIDAQIAALQDEDVRVFVFLCPVDIAQMIGRKLVAKRMYGEGFATILAPHLSSTSLMSDVSLYKAFNGALQVQFRKYARELFTNLFTNTYGRSAGLFSSAAYDATVMAATAVAAARAACLDPTNPAVMIGAMRNTSFAGASGDISWDYSINDRLELAANSAAITPAPFFELNNFVDFGLRKVGSIINNRLFLMSNAAVVFPGPSTRAPRQYRIAVHYSSSLASTAYIVGAVRSSLRYVLNVSDTSLDSLVLAPFHIIDGDIPTNTTAALPYAFVARPPMVMIGPAVGSTAASIFALQTTLQTSVPMISYGTAYEVSNTTQYPNFVRLSFGMENGVQFVLSSMQFYAQNRIGVIWCDDRDYSMDQKDSIFSWEAFQNINRYSQDYGTHLASTDQVPWNPQLSHFTKILTKYVAMSLTTVLLILPQSSSYQTYATASGTTGYHGTGVLTFVLSFTSYFPGIDVNSPALSNIASVWFVANFQQKFDNTPYNRMIDDMTTRYALPYNSLLGAPFTVTAAFDAGLVCNQLAVQAMRVGLNLMDPTSFISALRTQNLVSNDDGHFITPFVTGSVKFDPSSNYRIGAPGQMGIVQMLSLFPVRRAFQTSSGNFLAQALMNPPNFPNFLDLSNCCLDPGWHAVLNTSTNITRVSCLACPPNSWAPISAPMCYPCESGYYCSLGAPYKHKSTANFLKPTKAVVPLQIGQYILPQTQLDTLTNQYMYAGAGIMACVALLGLFSFVSRFCARSIHNSFVKLFKSFDIVFTLDHGIEVDQPLTPKQTATGGFFFIAFVVFASFAVVYFIDSALNNQFIVAVGSSAGFSDLLTASSTITVVPLTFSIAFIGIDNSAACALICNPNANTGTQFYFSADAGSSKTCSWALSDTNTTCTISYTSLTSSILLPPLVTCNITIRNSLLQAIYYEISAFKFLGKDYGLTGTLMARNSQLQPDPDYLLQGPVQSVLDVSLDPYIFNASLLSTAATSFDYSQFVPVDGAVGHLTSYLGESLGSKMNRAEVDAMSTSAGSFRSASLYIRFSRSQTVTEASLSSTLNVANQISSIAAFVASFLLVVLRAILVMLERSIGACRSGSCGKCLNSCIPSSKGNPDDSGEESDNDDDNEEVPDVHQEVAPPKRSKSGRYPSGVTESSQVNLHSIRVSPRNGNEVELTSESQPQLNINPVFVRQLSRSQRSGTPSPRSKSPRSPSPRSPSPRSVKSNSVPLPPVLHPGEYGMPDLPSDASMPPVIELGNEIVTPEEVEVMSTVQNLQSSAPRARFLFSKHQRQSLKPGV